MGYAYASQNKGVLNLQLSTFDGSVDWLGTCVRLRLWPAPWMAVEAMPQGAEHSAQASARLLHCMHQ